MPFENIEWNMYIRKSFVFYLFGLFWNIFITHAMHEFVIATACTAWYFGIKNDQVINSVSIGFNRAYTTSLGSICLGSCVLSFMWIFKPCFYIIDRVLYRNSRKKSK